MTAPNMATITASLERSLQNFSLNHSSSYSAGDKSSGSDSTENIDPKNDSSLALHSETPLPHFWEQCLDLKTGEIYYINWRTGMKSQEDPRSTNPQIATDCYSDDDSCSYDSEGSSSESSPSVVSKEELRQYNSSISRENNEKSGGGSSSSSSGQVLVVAGCKSCLMYFMVPKQVQDCPKCHGRLLLFDRSDNGSP